MNDSSATVKTSGTAGPRWLLLIHQIPPKPDYFRVKVRRRLQRIGAVALKNSVYVLPSRDDTLEDLRWLLRDIVADGGDGTLCEAELIEGITDSELEGLFSAERDAEYAEVVTRAQGVLVEGDELAGGTRLSVEAEIGSLRRRTDEIAALDFFGAAGRKSAERAIARLEARLQKPERAGLKSKKRGGEDMQGHTWVTRRDVHVDRIASAWLIRRFIDPKARFKFIDAKTYSPKKGEVRFDMFEAEYTHEGDRCTFETLLDRAGLKDRALRAIGEIVHDIDCKDSKFGREEAAGVAAMIRGLAKSYSDDPTRLERGAAALDVLYASLR
jgi:hypothetical protein